MLMDGLDTQTIGFNAVAIARATGIPIAAFGQIFSAGLLGAALGACCLGPVGDRFGRWPTLMASVIVFAVSSFVLPQMKSVAALLTCRFVTGVGLGAALPNLLALCAELVPRRLRGVVTGALFAGIPAGGFVGAMLTAHVAPKLGWPWVFYLGGAVPLVIVIVMAITAARQRAWTKADHRYTQTEITTTRQLPRVSPRDVLSAIGAGPTLLLWSVSLTCFVVLIDVALWTSPLLHQLGTHETTTALVVGVFNLGSVLGTLCGGSLLDRYRPQVTLPLSFLAGAIAVCMLGQSGGNTLLLDIFALLTGAFIGSTSAQLLAIAVLIYPASIRASGVGGVVAIGRFGQVFAPLAVGSLLKHAASVGHIYLVIASPAFVAVLLSLLLCRTTAVRQSIALPK
ncbi:MFS transporter [Paraburkholderia rhizosphaerae]|uniref:MFS transporter n=1 Tax=Paraburkholderia rhizosphaerae TaxID=480658 RepID=UPI001FB9F68A|nr:MFS transporter [Paraburkholderia rhizosphaerae]